MAGKFYLVGEQGLELLNMGAAGSGNITPNHQLSGMNSTQNINVTGTGDKNLIDAMATAAQEGAFIILRDFQRYKYNL